MDFNRIEERDLETIYPSTGIIFNRLDEEKKSKYILLYNIYRELFTQYIINKLQLHTYDEKLLKSGLDFAIIDEEDMDIYQFFSCELLKYIYVRNNVYIERLTKKEMEFLETKIKSGNTSLDEETIRFIEETYKKLIFEDIYNDGGDGIISYGLDNSSYFASNDSLIIGIRYDQFADNGLDDEEWDKLNDEQRVFLYLMIKQMNTDFEGKLQVPISVIEYDDISAIGRNDIGSEYLDDEEER